MAGVELDDGRLPCGPATTARSAGLLAGVARDAAHPLHEVRPTDESLESVFAYLVRQ